MWPLFVVLGEPRIQIGLQFFNRAVQLLAERDIVELILNGAMEALTDAVGLWRIGFGPRVIVSPRFLPQRLVLDAGDDVGVIDEVFEEAVPLFDGHTCGCEHVA